MKKIKLFPIYFFAVALGTCGFTLAVHQVEKLFSLNFYSYFLYPAVAVFSTVSFLYFLKALFFFEEVKKDLKDPIKMNFFPIFSICLLIFSALFLEKSFYLAEVLWTCGAVFHLIFSLKIISFWLYHKGVDINSMSPAWFIPAVGNIVVPIAGINFASAEVSWFFFSAGIIFWILLFTLVFYRIIFHNPLPDKLYPTFFILIAPAAIGVISYMKLTGGDVDSIGRILYYFALFVFLLLITQIKRFYKLNFYISWWTYSFPIAALINASLMMYNKTSLTFFKIFSLGLFSCLSLLIVYLLVKTIQIILRREDKPKELKLK